MHVWQCSLGCRYSWSLFVRVHFPASHCTTNPELGAARAVPAFFHLPGSHDFHICDLSFGRKVLLQLGHRHVLRDVLDT